MQQCVVRQPRRFSLFDFAPVWLQGYPFQISGKPFWSLPAFIPVIFELTVLFSASGAVIGMLFLNRLPQLNHPLFTSEAFRRVTQPTTTNASPRRIPR